MVSASMLHTDTECSEAPADLTGSRDAPHISTLPPDAALFAVEKAIPLLQELEERGGEIIFVSLYWTNLLLFRN